ncbi:ROK family transcriptional regulator [Streptomyces cinereospinus]
MAGRNGRTVRDLRRANRTAVLQRLYFDGPLSRFELGPATGLSSGSVSNVVADLVADGLVEEAGSVDSDGGRPRTLLRVAPGSGHMIGVDVGETRVRIELFDLALTELARTERPLEQQRYDVEVIVGHVRDGVAEVLAAADVAPRAAARGRHRCPRHRRAHPGPGRRRARPDDRLGRGPAGGAAPLHLPAPRERPVLHRQRRQDARPGRDVVRRRPRARNAAVVLFGSGVGACLVTPEVDHGRAVEWGHLTVRVRGRRCRCGALGCLEAYAGAESLLERWREEGGHLPEGTDEETALTALLAAAYPSGGAADPAALAVLEETAEYLGAGLSDLINLFQPERILIGGWAGLQLGAGFLPAVRRHAVAYALRHPAEKVTIELGRLGPDAVTVGAAILPLADFFARGGRRPEPAPQGPPPAWRAALRERAPH